MIFFTEEEVIQKCQQIIEQCNNAFVSFFNNLIDSVNNYEKDKCDYYNTEINTLQECLNVYNEYCITSFNTLKEENPSCREQIVEQQKK